MDDELEEYVGRESAECSSCCDSEDVSSVDCETVRCHRQCPSPLACECNRLDVSAKPCPPFMVNVSCRAVARPKDCGPGYQYEIIDIKTYPESGGVLCFPPNERPLPCNYDEDLPRRECKKFHRRPRRSPRQEFAKNGSCSPRRNRRSPSPQNNSSNLEALKQRTAGDSNGSPNDDLRTGRKVGEQSNGKLSGNQFRNANANSRYNMDTDNDSLARQGHISDDPEYYIATADMSAQPRANDTLRASSRGRGAQRAPAALGANLRSAEAESAFILRKKSSHFAIVPTEAPADSSRTDSGEVVLNAVDYRANGTASDSLGQPQKKSSGSTSTSSTTTTASNEHQQKMMKFLENLYYERQLTDATIQVGSCCFNVHRAVLSCYSKYFACRLLPNDCSLPRSVITLGCNIKPKIFNVILEFMYTGDCRLDRGNLAKVFAAADFLQMDDLKKRCERMISSNFQDVGHTGNITETERQWRQVAENFPAIVKTDQFLNLSPECIQKLLCRDDLVIESEMDVARAALRWLNFERAKRKKWAAQVMSCVNFKELSPEDLVKLSTNNDFLLDDEAVKEAILEANWYHTCQKRENTCMPCKPDCVPKCCDGCQ